MDVSTSVWLCVQNSIFCTSLSVDISIGVWKGILGIQDLSKTQNILTGFGIWLLSGKRDLPKFGHGIRDFLTCLSGIREIVTTQINILVKDGFVLNAICL